MKRKNNFTVILISSFFILFISADIKAQSRKNMVTPFRQGSVSINPGVGFGTDYKNEYARNSAFGTKAALEFGIWKAGPGVVSLGAEAGATISGESSRKYYDDFRSHTFVIAARSAWHFGWKVPGLDTYAGLSAGAGFHQYDYYDNYYDRRYSHNDAFPVVGGFVGASYFFTPRFGVNAEAGFDITSLQGGFIFKFK